MKAIKYVLGILTITIALLAQAQAQSFLTNGLVAYYPLNGTANDASGHGNNGTASNVTYATNRFGTPNNAASFAGNSSSQITINSTNVNVAPYFTVSLWVNPAANSGTGNPRIFSTTAYEFGTIGTSSNRIPYLAQWGSPPDLQSTNPIAAGSWTQLVGVCDGTNMLFYVNGVLVDTGPLGQPLNYIAGVFSTLAVRCEAGSDSYGGLLSDVRIYNIPFTSNQVAQLYAYENTPPFHTQPNGLVAYYPLNGNANDASGNGNNGTANVAYATNRFGVPNSAASFAGNSSSQITIDSTNVNVAPYFTVSLWVNPAANTGTGNPRILSTTAYEIGTLGTSSTRIPYLAQWGFSRSFQPANPVPAGSWSQLAAVCDGTNLLFYVNGVLVDSGPLGQPLTYIPGVLSTLAVRCEAGADSYGGLLSDVRIYNVPFTSNQVAQLFASENTPPPPGVSFVFFPGLVINGLPGHSYDIQSSSNLADTNAWITLTNLTLTQPVQIWVDTNVVASSPFNPKYFYRVLPGP